jgi:hypothetical protein
MKKKFTDSSIIALVAAVIMIVSLFLPYAAARPGFRQLIEMMPADMCIGNTDTSISAASARERIFFMILCPFENVFLRDFPDMHTL